MSPTPTPGPLLVGSGRPLLGRGAYGEFLSCRRHTSTGPVRRTSGDPDDRGKWGLGARVRTAGGVRPETGDGARHSGFRKFLSHERRPLRNRSQTRDQSPEPLPGVRTPSDPDW